MIFSKMSKSVKLSLLLLALFLGAFGPATYAADRTADVGSSFVEAATAEQSNDPLEKINRTVFAANDLLFSVLLKPIAEVYRYVVPGFVRDGLSNALVNLNSPFVLVNDLLQLEFSRAWITTQRMVINTTVGFGGFIDAAKDNWGIVGHNEDFGQTLGAWGVGEGFYLVLPLFGPSNPRDSIGLFSKAFIDPVSQYLDHIDEKDGLLGRVVITGVDEFSRRIDDLEKLKATSLDYYAAVRSIYRQKRQIEISNGTFVNTPLPNLQYDLNIDLASN
ncbi:MAG: VacJ family lipoprotein [Rhodospirillaceae bacterium]